MADSAKSEFMGTALFVASVTSVKCPKLPYYHTISPCATILPCADSLAAAGVGASVSGPRSKVARGSPLRDGPGRESMAGGSPALRRRPEVLS